MADDPVSDAPTPGDPKRRRRAWLAAVPPWVQAVTAIIAAVVAIVGVVIASRDKGEAAGPEVSVTRTSVDGVRISGFGNFARVDVNQDIVLLVRAMGDDSWVPIKALKNPPDVEDGTWQAEAQFPVASATLWPVVVPEGQLGFEGSVEDLRVKGPDASMVIASGPEVIASQLATSQSSSTS